MLFIHFLVFGVVVDFAAAVVVIVVVVFIVDFVVVPYSCCCCCSLFLLLFLFSLLILLLLSTGLRWGLCGADEHGGEGFKSNFIEQKIIQHRLKSRYITGDINSTLERASNDNEDYRTLYR